MYEKSRLVSMVTSNKRMCELHVRRLNIALELMNDPSVDVFIGGSNSLSRNYTPIIDTLAEYRYSIVMKNNQDQIYFTGKLLNCSLREPFQFIWGATTIGNIFNINGIIQFSNEAELASILPSLFVQARQDFSRQLKWIHPILAAKNNLAINACGGPRAIAFDF